MDDDTGSPGGFNRLVRWAIKPPQVYVVDLITLRLVWRVSFYAGTMNPKAQRNLGPPPPVAAPRN